MKLYSASPSGDVTIAFCFSFKRSDGSFSAFGERDESGSTWLTAYVCKYYNYMLSDHSDDNLQIMEHLRAGFNFLMRKQNDDGSFREDGADVYKNVQVIVDVWVRLAV